MLTKDFICQKNLANQQTSVIKRTEPNVVMNALHNYGAFAPCLNTTAREILREKYCIGPKICVSFLSPNCFINTFSFRHLCGAYGGGERCAQSSGGET